MILAGVDIGTLACRLLIATIDRGGILTALHADRRLLRLGEGLEQAGVLQPEPRARVLATLKEWRDVISRHEVDGEVTTGTSALREAANRDAFITKARRQAGFHVDVISGEEEARMTMLGIRSGLPLGVSDVWGVDIGGGSTEVITDVPGREPVVQSINLGAIRVTEKFLLHDPLSKADEAAARTWIEEMAISLRDRIGTSATNTFVGTAGTITTLAAMAQELQAYDSARLHNYALHRSTVRTLEGELLRRTVAQRRGLAGLEPGREDLIVGGTMILRGLMETFRWETCLVSTRGLREGIVLALAAQMRKA